jgi:tetratricopeptide (TPR) repeat protein
VGRLLPELLTAPPLPEGEDPRLRVQRAVAGFLQALAAETPLAVLLDDLHWADSASLALLTHLAHALRGERVLLLGTYRDVEVGRRHPLEATLTALTRDRVVEVLALRGLPPSGTADLIRARLGVETVSDELRDLVHERTEGNPFFTEEVLSALVEQRAIFRTGEGWDRKALAEIAVPQSVRSVVGQRVGRLVPEAQELLRLASVLGQEFDLPLLLGAVEQSEAEVLDHLEAALAMRLLEERRAGRGERYAFAHALIAQTLYDEVPRFRLRRLHLRAGESLERARGGRPEAAAELARHFLAGGDDERAARYAILAGDHAAALSAHAEALEHYEAALALREEARDEAGAAAVRTKLGVVLFKMNRPAEALAAFATALAAYGRLGDPAGQARVHREVAWIYQLGETVLEAEAETHLEQALALWPPDHEDAEMARLLIDAARVKWLVADAVAGRPLAARGLAMAERLGDDALQAQALVATFLLQDPQGVLVHDTIALLDRAEVLAQRAGDWLTLGRVYRNRGVCKGQAGGLRAAYHDLRRAVEVAEQADLPGAAASNAYVLANVCYSLGAWDEARSAVRKAQTRVQGIGMAMLLWMEGDFAGALRQEQDDLADLRSQGRVYRLMESLPILADGHLQLGQVPEADAAAREAWAIMQGRGYWDMAFAGAVLAEAAVRAGAPDAEAILVEAEGLVERFTQQRERPQLLRARGLLVARKGDLGGAVAVLQAGAETARAQGALVELGRTLAALAEMARAAGDAALAAEADAERAEVVARIGPEVRGLAWAR